MSMSDLGTKPNVGLWRSFVLRVSQWYTSLVLGRDMGPRLGAVNADLNDRILRGSVPDYEPSEEILGEAGNTVYDSNPSEILGRANRWSAALESRMVSGNLKAPARTVFTTYGLVSFRKGIRLCVIHYLEPSAIFRLRRRPPPISITGHVFPVVVRPASFTPMASRPRVWHSPSAPGNIWLKIRERKSTKLGYLTANHGVREAQIGDTVEPPTFRSPPSGALIRRSEVMDCVVIRTDFDISLDFKTVYPSSVIGYKPVRLIAGRREVDAQVVEHDGHIRGVMWRANGQEEPPGRSIVMLNRRLGRGHSGCLVVDCEFERFGGPAVPYAMYQGATQDLGLCQLLEQARVHWNLEFCEPWEEQDERKPRIS